MENKSRITIKLSDDAIAMLDKFTSPRKRGQFIENLIIAQSDSDGAAVSVSLPSRVRKIEKRLDYLEGMIVES